MKKLIFDTSAINALAADSDVVPIVQSLGLAFHIGITETVLAEVVANPEEEDRKVLLDLLKRLLKCGKCVMPFQWIIEAQAKAYQRDRTAYDWRKLNVRFPAAEKEITRQEIIHSVSDETRASHRESDKGFRSIFAAAKPAFQKLFEGSSGQRPSLPKVTDILLTEGGAHLSIGAELVERAIGTRPVEADVKDFMDRCPPFKALLVALCFSQYDRCIRGEREPSLGRAGRLDMFSAVYLPYCLVFVTNDKGQYKALTAVSELMELPTSILLYDEFKANLFGLSC